MWPEVPLAAIYWAAGALLAANDAHTRQRLSACGPTGSGTRLRKVWLFVGPPLLNVCTCSRARRRDSEQFPTALSGVLLGACTADEHHAEQHRYDSANSHRR